MTPMLLFGVVGESQEDDVQGLAKLIENHMIRHAV